MTLGPFVFAAPLALLGLIALPVIWFILRATPPAPKLVELPSLRLLDGVESEEETPAQTPWWVLLLRLVAAGLVIAGLSQPLFAPGAKTTDNASGPILVIIDDGWTSAQRWPDMRAGALSALDRVDPDGGLHLLLTAPRPLNIDPSERLDRLGFEARVRSLDPNPFPIDRMDALERLRQSGLRPESIVWVTDGLDSQTARSFADGLLAIAPLSIFAAVPRGPMALTDLRTGAEGVSLTVRRAEAGTPAQVFVSALTLDGAALATSEATFAADARATEASFTLPAAAFSRIARFQVTGVSTPGTVWLWDSTDRARRVGLVSGDSTAQPLLSDLHYVRKALEPFATLTEGDLRPLVEADPDAIIVTDIGQIDAETEAALSEWIEGGGALIRFAGPRLASSSDTLVPTPLRRASRAIGGALTWETPQPLAAFSDASPFAGLSVPRDALIRRQVLARPGPELSQRTWARLADGSPLVTADRRGEGSLILFHITAGPDWSDLPYSRVYVDMLRRAIAAGRGQAVQDADGLYTPILTLNGAGRLGPPDAAAAPLQSVDFAKVELSQIHPPGLYRGPAGTRTRNAARGAEPDVVTAWPAAAVLLGDADVRRFRLAGPLLGLAALLVVVDLIVALLLAGRFPRIPRRAALASAKTGLGLVFALSLASLIPSPPASAQSDPFQIDRSMLDLGLARSLDRSVDTEPRTKEMEAALEMRFAYVETGDAPTDRATLAGLRGLGLILFRRSSVEPAEPHAVDLEVDALDVYPLIFLVLPPTPEPLSEKAITSLNAYMRSGGALFIDTRRGATVGSSGSFEGLDQFLAGLDTPPLAPVPDGHVLSRSFYLLDGFPGRYERRTLWIEQTGAASREERRGDGVSRLFVGDADYLAAWAIDERGRPLYSVDGGDGQREMALRFGVNLVAYVLTGNYKEDQVHIPALLERLGEDEGVGDFERTPEDDEAGQP
ncbi:MAG: DUF4159 domain-containing protein [Pseudomonadota bacterium]